MVVVVGVFVVVVSVVVSVVIVGTLSVVDVGC